MTTPIGYWPLPPAADGPVAVWLDGGLTSAVCAAVAVRHAPTATALVPVTTERAATAARAIAGRLGLAVVAVPTPEPWAEPAGWGAAASAARGLGARVLALPATTDEAEPPLPLRLEAVAIALEAYDLSVWTPLVGYDPGAVARLALALELPPGASWDCEHPVACGECGGCKWRGLAFRRLGVADPHAT